MTTTIDKCIHGITREAVMDELNAIYRREQETGVREWGFLCSCCRAPSVDSQGSSYGSWTCPTCSLVEVE